MGVIFAILENKAQRKIITFLRSHSKRRESQESDCTTALYPLSTHTVISRHPWRREKARSSTGVDVRAEGGMAGCSGKPRMLMLRSFSGMSLKSEAQL